MNSSIPKLTVAAGSVCLEVVGRAAVIVWFVASNAKRINEIPVGKFVAFFAHRKTSAEIAESIESIRADLPTGGPHTMRTF